MRILHIIDSLEIGGAERLLVSVVNGMEGHEHHVISISSKTALASALKPEIKLTTLGFTGKADIFRCLLQVRRYIRQYDIEVVHAHLVMAGVIARMATPRSVPLFTTLHNLNTNRVFAQGNTWQKWLERLTYRKRHRVIAVSAAVLADYDQVIGVKGEAQVLYNFVEDRFFAAQPKKWVNKNRLRLVAVGSFKPQKNFPYLIKAMETLPAEVELDIYGGGSQQQELTDLIAHTQARVLLKGVHGNIHELLPQYDLFVMSSLFEGHPVALLEAMAAGLPALLSDIPVLKEVTGNQGIHFDLSDPSFFRDKIKRILNGEIDLDGNAAYNWDFAQRTGRKNSYMKKLEQLYLEAVHK